MLLAVVAWVYFDATELGKPAIPWAIAQPVLLWFLFLPLILYAIFREQGQHRAVPPGSARRQATYIVSFVGYAAITSSFSALLSLLFVSLTADVGTEAARQVSAASVAGIVIGAALWLPAWLPAEGRVSRIEDDAEFWATFYLHRSYLYTAVGTAVVVLAVSGVWFISGVLTTASGSDIDAEAWSWALGPIVVAVIAVAGHYGFYLKGDRYAVLLQRFEALAPPPMVGGAVAVAPVAAAAAAAVPTAGRDRFCRRCGAEAGPADTFCARCGNPLAAGA